MPKIVDRAWDLRLKDYASLHSQINYVYAYLKVKDIELGFDSQVSDMDANLLNRKVHWSLYHRLQVVWYEVLDHFMDNLYSRKVNPVD